MYDKLSLRYKVPLRTSALILIVGAVVSISIFIRSYQVFRQDLVTGSETLISIISRSLTPTILHDDVWISYEIINTPLAAAKEGTNLKPSAIIVLNPQGRVYVSTAPKIYPMLSDVRSSVPAFGKLFKALAASPAPGSIVSDLGLTHLYVATRIESDGVALGMLVILYPGNIFSERFFVFAKQAGLTVLITLAILLPLGAYWGHRIAEPLVCLSQCMKQVGPNLPEKLDFTPYDTGDEVGELIGQFQRMVDELKDKQALEREMVIADRLAAIGRFTAGIAHEINNPLGGLLNATSTLRKHGAKDELTQKTARLLDRGLYQIKDTVGALLVEARADGHAVTPQDIEDTRTLIIAEAAGKGAELDWRNEITSEVKIPATAARQILINLLLNAIHAIPDQGRIICQIKTHNGHLEFFTQNEGPQISQERMEQLFEPFSSGTRGGRGLGLWVTYQLVQSLDGEITVSSGTQDTQFVVRLPIQEAA